MSCVSFYDRLIRRGWRCRFLLRRSVVPVDSEVGHAIVETRDLAIRSRRGDTMDHGRRGTDTRRKVLNDGEMCERSDGWPAAVERFDSCVEVCAYLSAEPYR
jgi:hypothetical protein